MLGELLTGSRADLSHNKAQSPHRPEVAQYHLVAQTFV